MTASGTSRMWLASRRDGSSDLSDGFTTEIKPTLTLTTAKASNFTCDDETLLVLRHAKSSWNDTSLDDHDDR